MIIDKLRSGRVCQRPSVNAEAVSGVVSERRDFKAVQVACNDRNSCAHGVLVGSVNSTLIAVFHDHAIGRPAGPARGPSIKVVFKAKPFNVFILRGIGCEAVFVPGIVVSKRPDQLYFAVGLFSGVLNLAHRNLAGFKFLDDGRGVVPANTRKSGDAGSVENVTIGNHCLGFEFVNGPDQAFISCGVDARPKVGIAENNNCSVFNAKADARGGRYVGLGCSFLRSVNFKVDAGFGLNSDFALLQITQVHADLTSH